jgi:hypothetical protein
MREDDRDLPEGVINADPTGGWQRADAAGGTDVGEVESDQPSQGADPDLATDADADEER